MSLAFLTVTVQPTRLILGMAGVPPLIYTIYLSMKGNWLNNYTSIFSPSSSFIHSLIITFELVIITLPIQIILGIIIASVLNRKHFLKMNKFVKVILILPFAITPAVVGVLFRMMMDRLGILTYFTNLVGLHVEFLGMPTPAFISTCFVTIWMGVPLVALIILAGLTDIPKEAEEAARLETNSWLKIFWHIQLPYLRSYLTLVVILQFSQIMQIFDMPFSLTNGGPIDATQFISLSISI